MDAGSRWIGPDHLRKPASFHEVADSDRDEVVFQHGEETGRRTGGVSGARMLASTSRISFPKVSHEAAQKHVAKLEGVLKAFGDATREVMILQETCHRPGLLVQAAPRAQRRLVAHNEERTLLVKQLEDGQQRLHRF